MKAEPMVEHESPARPKQAPGTPGSHDAFLQALIQQQIQLMSKQLLLMGALGKATVSAPGIVSAQAAPASVQMTAASAPQLTNAPLGPGQLEHWLAATASKQSRIAINESLCLHFDGPVDVPVLRQAAEAVMARHDAFRLTFDSREPVQSLQQHAAIRINHVDLRGRPDVDDAFDALCKEAGAQCFELAQAPLAAAYIVQLAEARTAFLLIVNHLIFDGWAASLFVDELGKTYRGLVEGNPVSLPPPASALAFHTEQVQQFAGPEGDESLAYWTRELADPPRLLNLHDRPEPPVRLYACDTVRAALDEECVERMRRKAASAGVTFYQFMLAAVATLLRNCSGRDDFVVGIPFASQALQASAAPLADGVLDLPLRLRLGGASSMEETLKSVRSCFMDAIEHPLMTQGIAARALRVRGTGRPPLTGIYFNLNPDIDVKGFGPLRVRMTEAPKQGILNDLFFSFYQRQGQLALELHFAADLFTRARVCELVDSLWAVCRRWSQPDSGEIRAVTALPPPAVPGAAPRAPEQTLPFGALFARQVSRAPDRVSMVVQGESVTYLDLDLRSDAIANALAGRGVRPGALVGVCLGRDADLVPALLGIWKAGAAYVPLDPAFPVERLRYMAEDAGVALLVTDATHAHLLGTSRDAQLRVDDDAVEISAAAHQRPPQTSDDAPAYVIYTSGSTGKPKGVVVPHRAVGNFLCSMLHSPGLTEADVLLAVTTLSFDIAVLELFLPLTVGAQIVLATREDAMDGRRIAALIRQHGVTVKQATPTAWQMLLESGWQPPPRFKALCGGEPLPPMLADALVSAGVELWNLYGPTETTVWSTAARVTEPLRRIHVGVPIDNTLVWVVDEGLNPCGAGEAGEILIGGAGVAIGYHNRPQLTAERFITARALDPSGRSIYRTGDLGRWASDGVLEHLGRQDTQVKIRGHRIELGEIESVIAQMPGVADVVVTAEPGTTSLVAFVRAPAGGGAPDMDSIRARVADALPDYMIPAKWLVVDAFPLTPNGKVDRKALLRSVPTLVVAHSGKAPHVAPETDAEFALVPVWSSVLQVENPGVMDDFFDAGGHSILAMKLMMSIQRDLGHDLPLEALFSRPNIRGLAAAISNRLELGTGVMVPLREGRAGPVLMLIAGVGGHIFAYHKFALSLTMDVPVYGMKAIGIDGKEEPLDDIPLIAARYVRELLAVHPDGPFVIAGYSVGARIALEVALQLEALGKSVPRLVSFDMYAPRFPKPVSILRRVAFHWRRLQKRDMKAVVRYLKERSRLALADEAERDQHELEKLGIIPREILESIGKGLLRAGTRYKPRRKMQGRIVSVICTQREAWQDAVEMVSDNGWSQYTTAGVDVHEVGAGHVDLFKQAVFGQMTDLMHRVLTEARDASGTNAHTKENGVRLSA